MRWKSIMRLLREEKEDRDRFDGRDSEVIGVEL